MKMVTGVDCAKKLFQADWGWRLRRFHKPPFLVPLFLSGVNVQFYSNYMVHWVWFWVWGKISGEDINSTVPALWWKIYSRWQRIAEILFKMASTWYQWNEYNWNATSIVIDGKIMKPNFAWYFTQTRVSGWSITRVSFATIPRTNYEERANDKRTTWRQTWVPRESKFAVCLKHTYRCSYSHEKYHYGCAFPYKGRWKKEISL